MSMPPPRAPSPVLATELPEKVLLVTVRVTGALVIEPSEFVRTQTSCRLFHYIARMH